MHSIKGRVFHDYHNYYKDLNVPKSAEDTRKTFFHLSDGEGLLQDPERTQVSDSRRMQESLQKVGLEVPSGQEQKPWS